MKFLKNIIRLTTKIEGFYHYFNEWDKGPLHVWFKYNVRTGHITYILVDCPEEVKKIVIKNAGDQYGCFLHQPLAIDVLIAEQCASWREDLINKRYKQIFVWVSFFQPQQSYNLAEEPPVARKQRHYGHEPSPKNRSVGQKQPARIASAIQIMEHDLRRPGRS